MDILGIKFICTHGNEGLFSYMFHPYTNYAPAPWKFERTKRWVNNHPWTLFVRQYYENVDICENIDFDQTRDAGLCHIESLKRGDLSPFSVTNNRLKMFTRYMNITMKMMIDPANTSFGYIGEDGKSHGSVADLTNGPSDIVMQIAPLPAVPEPSGSYLSFAKLFAVTQYTSYPSQWEKITTVIDFNSRIGVLVVIIIIVIILKYGLHQSFMMVVLNRSRVIVCNGSFTKFLNNLGPRIYLVCLLCFVVITQALYHGQLAARLSEHVRYPNVNNKPHLINSDYILYGRENDIVIFSDRAFDGRFVPLNVFAEDCTILVKSNSAIACVGGREHLINSTLKSKLHMSTDPVAELPMKNSLRHNWPLEERQNTQNSHYSESGVRHYHGENPFTTAFHTLDVNENGSGDNSFKVLNVTDLNFVFVIVGIGLGSRAEKKCLGETLKESRDSLV